MKPSEICPNNSSYGLRKRKPVSYVAASIPSYVDSAVGVHLLENPECAKMYSNANFEILLTARNSYHLNVVEALYINSMKPLLCRQKKFIYYCRLFPNTFINDIM